MVKTYSALVPKGTLADDRLLKRLDVLKSLPVAVLGLLEGSKYLHVLAFKNVPISVELAEPVLIGLFLLRNLVLDLSYLVDFLVYLPF